MEQGAKQGFYAGLEDKFYAFMESLEAKGIPAVKFFVEPLENKGVPSFPVAMLLLALLLAGGIFAAWALTAPQATALEVRVYANNAPLAGVQVTAYDGDMAVSNATTGDDGIARLEGLQTGREYTIRAFREGYGLKTASYGGGQDTVRFDLSIAVAIEIPEPTPEPEWSFKDAHDEDATGKIVVSVSEAATGKAVATTATVKLYDYASGVEKGTAYADAANGGITSFEDVAVDSRVFITASAEGYIPFDGSNSPITVQGGVNNLNAPLAIVVTRQAAGSPNASINSASSVISLSGDSGAAIAGKVEIYRIENNRSILLTEKTANAAGAASFDLNNSLEYYAVAYKAGYFKGFTRTFYAGENLNVTLVKATADNTADLTVIVHSEEGAAVGGAAVQPFAFTGDGFAYSLAASLRTGNSGQAVFRDLPLGANAVANASKGGSYGTAAVTLSTANTTVQVTLYYPAATLVASAKNLLTNASIPATFSAFLNGTQTATCEVVAGASCNLTVPSRKLVTIHAASSGFETLETVENLQPQASRYAEYYLMPSSAVNGTAIYLVKVASTAPLQYGETVTSLKLGKTYTIYYNFYGNAGDLRGAYARLGGPVGANGDAKISGRTPPGALEKAGATLACSPVDYNPTQDYAWLDSAFAQNTPTLIRVNMTVDENAALDETSHYSNLTVFYRSYYKQGADYVRNPYTPSLGVGADSPLPSGCDALAYNESYPVLSPKTLCQNGACITLEYEQDNSGLHGEGFEAQDMSGLDPQDDAFHPLEIHYTVELFKNLDAATGISFNSLPENTQLMALTVPNAQCDGGQNVVVSGNSFSVDLSYLKDCPSYHDYDPATYPSNFQFSGTILAKPTGIVAETPAALQFTTGSVSSVHNSYYRIIALEEGVSSDYAAITALFTQTDNATTPVPQPSANIYTMYSMSDCTALEIAANTCHHKLAEANAQIEVKRARDVNTLVLTAQSGLEMLQIELTRQGTPKQTFTPTNPHSFAVNLGAVTQENTHITLKIITKPVTHDGEPISGYAISSFLKIEHSTTDSLGAHTTTLQKNALVRDYYQEQGGHVTGIEGGDCGQTLYLSYDDSRVAEQRLMLNGGNCTTLGMKVSPVFPADGVKVNVSIQNHLGPRYVLIQGTGDSQCFELCDYDPLSETPVDTSSCGGFTQSISLTQNKTMVLRYHPEALCKEKGVVANHLSTTSAQFLFWGAGDEGKETAGKNLTILVQNETTLLRATANGSFVLVSSPDAQIAPGLFVGPVMKKLWYSDCTGVITPQLWAVTNNKQTTTESPRRFIIANRIQSSGQGGDKTEDEIKTSFDTYFLMQFDEPSTQVFAFEPATDEQLTIFEEDPLIPYHYIEIARCSLNPDAADNCFLDGLGNGNADFPKGLTSEFFYKTKAAAIKECNEHSDGYYIACWQNCEQKHGTGNSGYSSSYEQCAQQCPNDQSELDTDCKAACMQQAGNEFEEPINPFDCQAYCADITRSSNGNSYGCLMNLDYLQNEIYDKGKTQEFLEQPIADMINDTRALAELKAFWRGKSTTMWCDQDAPSKCMRTQGGFKPEAVNDPECCRATADEWRNMTPKNISEQISCTFCNQTDKYPDCGAGECSETAPDVYQCDSRCEKLAPGTGNAGIGYGDSFNASVCSIPTYLTATLRYTQSMSIVSKDTVTTCAASGICAISINLGKPSCVFDSNGDGYAQASETLSSSTDTGTAYSCANGTIIAVAVLPSQNKVFKASATACTTAYCGMALDATMQKPLCQNNQSATAEGDFYKCAPSDVQTQGCSIGCANWCDEPNCLIGCSESGLYWNETYGPLEQTGWLTRAGRQPVQVLFSATADDPLSQTETFQNYKPYSYFPEDYRYTPGTSEDFIQYGPSYRHSVLVNTLGLVGFDFYEGMGLNDPNAWRVQGTIAAGCQHAGDVAYWNNQGLYDLRFGNELISSSTQKADLWQGNLNVVSLKMSDQLGATQCSKGTATQNPVTEQELCAPVYADQSETYGNCINSLWLFGSEQADNKCGDVLKVSGGPLPKYVCNTLVNYKIAEIGKANLFASGSFTDFLGGCDGLAKCISDCDK